MKLNIFFSAGTESYIEQFQVFCQLRSSAEKLCEENKQNKYHKNRNLKFFFFFFFLPTVLTEIEISDRLLLLIITVTKQKYGHKV